MNSHYYTMCRVLSIDSLYQQKHNFYDSNGIAYKKINTAGVALPFSSNMGINSTRIVFVFSILFCKTYLGEYQLLMFRLSLTYSRQSFSVIFVGKLKCCAQCASEDISCSSLVCLCFYFHFDLATETLSVQATWVSHRFVQWSSKGEFRDFLGS